MHLGNVWTALLAWLGARSQAGAMVLRMEDLDPARSKKHFARAIQDDLSWLGLTWDEGPDTGGPFGPYRQDQRRALYQRHLEDLASRGLLYPCWCTRAELRCEAADTPRTDAPETAHAHIAQAPHAGESEPVYAGTCLRRGPEDLAGRRALGRTAAMRVRVAAQTIRFADLVQGEHSEDLARCCGDFVLRRADGVHAYQLAVVADDAAQHITQVVRGADLLDSTARQIFLYRLFGWPEPSFAHVPLLVDANGVRLSKRRGDADVGRLRQAGVAPEKIIGYLAWKARLLERPHPVRPGELVDGFRFGTLPKGPVVVEEGWVEQCL